MYSHALRTPVDTHVRACSIDACRCYLRRRYFAEELDAAAAVDCYARLRGQPCPNFPHGRCDRRTSRSLTLQEVSCDDHVVDCSWRHVLGVVCRMLVCDRCGMHTTKHTICMCGYVLPLLWHPCTTNTTTAHRCTRSVSGKGHGSKPSQRSRSSTRSRRRRASRASPCSTAPGLLASLKLVSAACVFVCVCVCMCVCVCARARAHAKCMRAARGCANLYIISWQ